MEKSHPLTIALLAFAISLYAYRFWDVFFKRYSSRGIVYHKWTLSALALSHSLLGILTICEYLFLRAHYNPHIAFIAVFIFALGQTLRNQAIKALGPYHSPHIEIKSTHSLITTFPYNKLRHPYYLGVILEVLATPLIFNAYLSFFFALLTYIPTLIYRIVLEEKALKSHFGKIYDEYANAVRRFVPKKSATFLKSR